MAVAGDSPRGQKLKVWATIVGGIAAIMEVVMFFSQISGWEGELTERDGFKLVIFHVQELFMFTSAIVTLLGYLISWWHRLPAGILLVLAEVILITISLLPASFQTPLTHAEAGESFIFSIPSLAAGVLFLWSWGLSKKSTPNTASA